MKKTIYLFAAAAVMLGATTSCNDELDLRSTSQFIPEDVWNNEDAADGYIIASYLTFDDYSNNYNIDANKFYDAYSDIAKSTSWDQYSNLYNKTWMLENSFGKNNAGVFDNWGTAYVRIKRANRLLMDLDEYGLPIYGEEWCKVRRAEIRFCRAMSYFFLARVYGGVVIRTDKTGVNGGMDDGKYEADCHRARVSEEETYDFIISEMKAAIEDLPTSWPSKYVGRATKGMVNGFLSRVAVFGKRWDVAVQAADDCKKYGGYDLKRASSKDFDALVENYKSLFNCKNDAANRVEVIYAIYGKKDIKMNDYDVQMRPFGDSRKANMGKVSARVVPTAELSDMYEFKDGNEIDWDFWDWDYPDPYSQREPRFQATILYDGAQWEGRTIETFPGGTDAFGEYQNAASTNGHTPTGYYFRKYLMENEEITTANRSYNTEIILRYAEVLLNKAEALAEQNKISEALVELNKVRDRVGLPPKSATDKDAFMKILRKERACEFAGEGLRFWDLRRWGIARETIDGQTLHGHKVTKTPSGLKSYQRIDVDGGNKRIYQERYQYFSLPSGELDNNNLCKDNPGW